MLVLIFLKAPPVQIWTVHPIFLAYVNNFSCSFLSFQRRPLPLRLESRRASILSLSNFESNLGLQVDLDLDHLDSLVDHLDDIDDLLHAPDKLYDLEDFNL